MRQIPFDVWAIIAMHNHPHDPNNIDDMDLILLCSKPSQKATWYTRMHHLGTTFKWKIHNPHCCKHTTVELLQYLRCQMLILNVRYH